MRRPPVFLSLFALAAAFIALLATQPQLVGKISGGEMVKLKMQGRATVSDRLAQYGEAARSRWEPFFQKAGVTYPPQRLVFAAFKQEKRLEVYAAGADGVLRFVRSLPVQAASGNLGPKLQFGDNQVPEGFYRIESLNPNSVFHLSLRVNYPNEFDREHAVREGRTDLGGDIMVHGSNASIGCLAMGDEGAEDLFILAADVGRENIELIISPVDFRERTLPQSTQTPAWMQPVYQRIQQRLIELPSH